MYKNVCFRNTILMASSTPEPPIDGLCFSRSPVSLCASLSDLIYELELEEPSYQPRATVGHLAGSPIWQCLCCNCNNNSRRGAIIDIAAEGRGVPQQTHYNARKLAL